MALQPYMSMITLGVDDLPKAIKFYEEGLGFPRMESPPTVAFFTLGGAWLGLFGRKELAEDANVELETASFNSVSISHNVASPEAVDDVLAQAVAAGATLTKPAGKVFWGGYNGYFRDPEGHLWEVAHNPFAWVGPKEFKPAEYNAE